MDRKFYIMGSHNMETWYRVEGPSKKIPDLDTWTPSEGYTYRHYKVEEVWEFPF